MRPKFYGPYEHGNQFRVHRVTTSRGKRKTGYETFATRALADAYIAGARDEAQGVTVNAAIDQYLEWMRVHGRADDTIVTTRRALEGMLEPYLQRPLRSIASQGEDLYAAAQVDRAADTHQVWLGRARKFAGWCVRQRWLKTNPFSEIEPAGRRIVGADKERLRIDEWRKLEAWCYEHTDDLGAVLTLAYGLFAARASELVGCDVRDVDDQGRLLWIGGTKTAAARRSVEVPEEFRPVLLRLCEGRPSEAPLFATDGKRWSRFTARLHVLRVTAAAGVPEISPQGMRRMHSSIARGRGATAHLVARQLGHEHTGVTERSYIDRETTQTAQAGAVLRVLQGGRR